MTKKNIIIAVLGIVVLGVVLFIWNKPVNRPGSAPAGPAIENYVPVIQQDSGYYSALGIWTTSTFRADTSIAIGSSTPSQEVGIVGSISAEETTGTTTASITSAGTNVGGCLALTAVNGSHYRAYLVASTTGQSTNGIIWRIEPGACQ